MDHDVLTKFYNQYRADRNFSQGDMVVGQDLGEFGTGISNGIYILLSGKKFNEYNKYTGYYDAACLTRGNIVICELSEHRILEKYNVEHSIT